MIEDMLLIWKLKNGQEQVLVRTYVKYKNYLLKIAYALVNNSEQVEDVVQDIFVSLAESAPRLRLDGNLKGYLVRSLINRVHNLKKA
ncbi:MAG: sigma-70 family RNA polymerase sigma factor [Planctomycetes bacterium]|nr:sigma-70 family RNA polymerase sigma factor [Planctomycetota bacterium]MBL7143253.1 sigma-70 family RNA polymerase sigma factor [Phycisphaerae bacterium]